MFLHEGMKSKNVGYAQRMLGLPITRKFDSVMANAVRHFQKSHGLAADAIIGPITWNTLKKYAVLEVGKKLHGIVNKIKPVVDTNLETNLYIEELVRRLLTVFVNNNRNAKILRNTLRYMDSAEVIDIRNKAAISYYFGQMLQEVTRRIILEENFNYSPIALINTFKYYAIHKKEAYQDGRTYEHPARRTTIANKAYANRYGNGPISSNDGSRYAGKGTNQLTFRNNYSRCNKWSKELRNILDYEIPDILETPNTLTNTNYCWLGSLFFWKKHEINTIINSPTIEEATSNQITSIYNYYTNSSKRRYKLTKEIYRAI